jgi:hypothetical protein
MLGKMAKSEMEMIQKTQFLPVRWNISEFSRETAEYHENLVQDCLWSTPKFELSNTRIDV